MIVFIKIFKDVIEINQNKKWGSDKLFGSKQNYQIEEINSIFHIYFATGKYTYGIANTYLRS